MRVRVGVTFRIIKPDTNVAMILDDSYRCPEIIRTHAGKRKKNQKQDMG